MPGRTPGRIAAAAVAVLAAAVGSSAIAQPSGASVRFGSARIQQAGASLLVTTHNGAGSLHSVIDWRSFSVPAGSTTHFQQPSVDSLSINRVTGGRPSDIFGTLSSNGRLLLVNPAGIAVGKGAVVDTAGFTASALALDDGDAVARRLRFTAGRGKGDVDVRGRILARAGDVVLLGTEVKVDKEALVQARNGAVILAAGQRVALTGRGLEGIVLELRGKEDRVVNLGRLEGDAVGLFATQLRHTGAIQASRVVLDGERVKLERGAGKEKVEGDSSEVGGSIEPPPPQQSVPPGAPLQEPVREPGTSHLPRELQVLVTATALPESALNGASVAATLTAPTSADPLAPPRSRKQPDPALQCVR